MTAPKPELFADGECGARLPAGEILQEFRFGQYCPFVADDGAAAATVLVDEVEPQKWIPAARAGLGGRSTIGFAEMLELTAAPIMERMEVRAALPAARASLTMAVAEKPEKGGDGGGEIAYVKVSREVDEDDVEKLIADPRVTIFGTSYDFPLTSEQVADLRAFRSIQVEIGHLTDNIIYDVTFTVKRKPPPPPPSDTGDGTGTGTDTGTDTGTGTGTNGRKPDTTYDPDPVDTGTTPKDVLLAVYLEWTQRWTLQGFSRGRLLQSLALAPQEDTTIELFTWDRHRKSLEQSTVTDTEQTIEDEEKTQDAEEVLRELSKKDEFELKGGGDLDVQYDGGAVKVKIGGELDVTDRTDVEDVVKNTGKAIRDGLHKSSSRIKAQRSSKVTETSEWGSEQRTTRRVRNPNLCHTLNLDYFEILTHYRIDTQFSRAGMRFCAMVLNPIAETAFAPEFIRQHEGALRDALLDRSLAAGFDALRLLRAREVAQGEIKRRREEREHPSVPTSPLPPPPAAGLSVEESAANNHLGNLRAAAKRVFETNLGAALDRALTALGLETRPSTADLDGGKRWLSQQLFLRSFSQLSAELSKLAAAGEGPQIREWGPRLGSLMPALAAMPRPSQLNLETQEVKEGLLRPMLWTPTATGPKHVKQPWDWAWWWGEVKRVGLMEAEDGGLGTLVEQFGRVYRAFLEAEKRTPAGGPGAGAVQDAQRAQERVNDEDRLENDFPLRDYAYGVERAEMLQTHLQAHAHHYCYALFRALPPQEQLDYIEAAMARMSPRFPPGYFQPRVVSQIGRRLLVPLNHSLIRRAGEFLEGLRATIPDTLATDYVIVPSPGLTIESRIGHCSAAEAFIEETRALDLEQRRAEVRQAQAEAARLEQRLTARPPQLDDPRSATPELRVELERPAT
jgi:hypothetical protein